MSRSSVKPCAEIEVETYGKMLINPLSPCRPGSTEMEIAIITERACEQPFGGNGGDIWRCSPTPSPAAAAAPLENEKSAPSPPSIPRSAVKRLSRSVHSDLSGGPALSNSTEIEISSIAPLRSSSRTRTRRTTIASLTTPISGVAAFSAIVSHCRRRPKKGEEKEEEPESRRKSPPE